MALAPGYRHVPLPYYEEYRYTPVPGSGWIRVLTLYPFQDIWCQDPIIGTLEEHELRTEDDYAALSYSWAMADGDDLKSREILIDGRSMKVTRNLFDGLLRIRKSDSAVRLWADAICINQDDVGERSDQVAQMCRIYASAVRVIAWLGEHNERRAFDVLQYLVECTESASGPDRDPSNACRLSDRTLSLIHQQSRNVPEEPATICEDRKTELDHSSDFLTHLALSLSSIFKKRYFSRRWIVQELYHSKHVDFILGSRTLPMDGLVAASDDCLRLMDENHESLELSEFHDPIWSALKILEMRKVAWAQPKGIEFHDIVSRCSRLECSDPRDIIFALTSMSPSCEIRPDYAMSTTRVYMAFSDHLLRSGNLELLLKSIQHRNTRDAREARYWKKLGTRVFHPSQGSSLPSFVLDLSEGFDEGLSDSLSSPLPTVKCGALTARIETANYYMTCNVYLIGVVSKFTDVSLHVRVAKPSKGIRHRLRGGNAKVFFPEAPLARKGDHLFTFAMESWQELCTNVILVRAVDYGCSYKLLHWCRETRLEPVRTDKERPPLPRRKYFIRIV